MPDSTHDPELHAVFERHFPQVVLTPEVARMISRRRLGAGRSLFLQGQAPTGMKLVQGALLHAFKEAGWVDMGRLASRAHSTKKHIFCAPDMVNLGKSALRNMVQDPPTKLTPLARLVK